MKTRIIALDIYGTILESDDYENEMPVREGFEEFVKRAKDSDLTLVTSSDEPTYQIKEHLELAFRKSRFKPKPTLNLFDRFYQLTTIPKDFSQIIEDYRIKPEQLFVIGDQYLKDIEGAKALGCLILHVPEYGNPFVEDFDFSNIEIP